MLGKWYRKLVKNVSQIHKNEVRGDLWGGPGGSRRRPGGSSGQNPKRGGCDNFPRGSRGTLSDPNFRKNRFGGSKIQKKRDREFIEKTVLEEYGKIYEKGPKMEPKTMQKLIGNP